MDQGKHHVQAQYSDLIISIDDQVIKVITWIVSQNSYT